MKLRGANKLGEMLQEEKRTPEVRVGVLTVSDRAAQGKSEDRSGPIIVEYLLRNTGWDAASRAVVPDEPDEIRRLLLEWCAEGLNLILTTGGTGFSPRDVTPEVTKSVIEREAPGIAEALRNESLKITRHAMLSRAVAGMLGTTLIINLPGSPKAVIENLQVLTPVLPHALNLLSGAPGTEERHRSV